MFYRHIVKFGREFGIGERSGLLAANTHFVMGVPQCFFATLPGFHVVAIGGFVTLPDEDDGFQAKNAEAVFGSLPIGLGEDMRRIHGIKGLRKAVVLFINEFVEVATVENLRAFVLVGVSLVNVHAHGKDFEDIMGIGPVVFVEFDFEFARHRREFLLYWELYYVGNIDYFRVRGGVSCLL